MNQENQIQYEYTYFKKLIFQGALHLLKHEYIHILYQIYKYYLRCVFNKFITNTNLTEDDKSRYNQYFQNEDFKFCPKYQYEMKYLENVFKNPFNSESIKNDVQINKILSKDFKIILSQYALEILQTYIQRNHLKIIQQMFFSKDKEKIMVSKNLLTESYIKQFYIENSEYITNLEKINQRNYILGMLRDNYNYLIKLEEIILKKKQINEKGVEVTLPHKYPIEKSSATFLSNCPEYKNKFLIDLAKNYINRKTITKDNLTSVLQIGLIDPENEINLVQFTHDFKVILLATNSGLIIGYQLFEDSTKTQQEEYSKEKRNILLGQKTLSHFNPQIKNLDFNLKTNKIQYIGHKAVVTCMDISFNSSYFISGSADSQIRLWNILSGVCLAVYKGHIQTIWNVKICQRGFYFISACSDSLIFLWSTNSPKPLKRFTGHKEEITCLEFTKNMIYFITASYDLTIRIWNIDERELVRIFFVGSPVMCLEVNEVGQILITGDQEGDIIVWEINKGLILKKFNFCKLGTKNENIIRGINLSFDENYILIYNSSTFAYYNFTPFKQEISKDIYDDDKKCRYEIEPEKEGIIPFQKIRDSSLSFQKVLFNVRNIIIACTRENNQSFIL